MITNNQKIKKRNLQINNIRCFLLKVTEKEEIDERKNSRKILINSEDLETVRQRYYNHSHLAVKIIKKKEINKSFCQNIIPHSNYFSSIKSQIRIKSSLKMNTKNNLNYNHDNKRNEDENDLFSIYLHYLLKKENICIQINNCENLEKEFKKILKLLGPINKGRIDYNIKLLHKYCHFLKKRNHTPEKMHKKILERKKTYKFQMKEKYKEKIPLKNEIVRKSLPFIFHKKNYETKNNKALNNIFENYKENKSKRKLKKNITLLKINPANMGTEKIKKNKDFNQNTLLLKTAKTKNNSPLDFTHEHKKMSMKKRQKEKKETAKYPLSKKFKAKNFFSDKNETVESRRKSCFQLANRNSKKKNSNSKIKKHNDLACSNSHSRKCSKNKEFFDFSVKVYKRQTKSLAEQMRKSHKLSKEKYFKKHSKKHLNMNKKSKKKNSNFSAFNEYEKYNTDEREIKSKKNNLSNNEHQEMKSKIVKFKSETQNRDVINSFPSNYEGTYNEEGMDELLFMKKVKRNRKK